MASGWPLCRALDREKQTTAIIRMVQTPRANLESGLGRGRRESELDHITYSIIIQFPGLRSALAIPFWRLADTFFSPNLASCLCVRVLFFTLNCSIEPVDYLLLSPLRSRLVERSERIAIVVVVVLVSVCLAY